MGVYSGVEPQCPLTAFSQATAISLPSGEESRFLFGLVLGCEGETADSKPIGVTHLSVVGTVCPVTPAPSFISGFVSGDKIRCSGSSIYPLRLQHFFLKGELFLGFI